LVVQIISFDVLLVYTRTPDPDTLHQFCCRRWNSFPHFSHHITQFHSC